MNQYEDLITFYEVLLVNYTNTYNSNYNLNQLTFHFCKTDENKQKNISVTHILFRYLNMIVY